MTPDYKPKDVRLPIIVFLACLLGLLLVGFEIMRPERYQAVSISGTPGLARLNKRSGEVIFFGPTGKILGRHPGEHWDPFADDTAAEISRGK